MRFQAVMTVVAVFHGMMTTALKTILGAATVKFFGTSVLMLTASQALAQDMEFEEFEPPVFEMPDFAMPPIETPRVSPPGTALPGPASEATDEQPPRDIFRSEASQPNAASTDWLTEVYDRILPNADDSWVLTLRKTRTGYDKFRTEKLDGDSWRETYSTWRYGPASVSVRLATWDSADHYGEGGILVKLASWPHKISNLIERAKKQRSYENIADALLEQIDAVKARRDDAELLIRVLQGLQVYTYIENRDYDTGNTKPVSDNSIVHLDGATFDTRFTGMHDEPSVSSSHMPAWTSTDPGADENTAYKEYSAVIWRYSPEEMARVRELISTYDTVEQELTLDLSDVDIPADFERSFGLSSDTFRTLTQDEFHDVYRAPFLAALYEVARLAWWIGPTEAPQSTWVTREDDMPEGLEHEWEVAREQDGLLVDRAGTPYINKSTPLELPPLPTDTLAILKMPVFGIRDEPGELDTGNSYFGSLDIGNAEKAKHTFSTGSAGRHRTTNERMDELFWARTMVHAAATGETFSGQVKVVSQYLDVSEDMSNDSRFARDQRQEHLINWTLSHDGDIWAPGPPDIAASVVEPDGNGGYQAFAGKLEYGRPFAIEGRLELPAARNVYTLEIDYGGDRVHDVLLYPTEQDPQLLRSDILYLMWDVAHADPASDGSEDAQ